MSNSSTQKPRKRRDDKLDWEELESAPNVGGMYSYLRTPPPPQPGITLTKTAEVVQIDTSLGRDSLPSSLLPSASQPSPSHGSEAHDSVLPTSDSAWASRSAVSSPLGRRRIRRCTLVQDAHTPGEQVVLATLFRLGKQSRWGHPQPDGSCLVGVSLAELSIHAGMHETNVRNNIRSLTDKLAIDLIEREDKKLQSARRYRVYSYRQILERRRTAGLEWVVRSRGVRFISKHEVDQALASEALPSDNDTFDESLPREAPSPVGSDSRGSLGSISLSLPILDSKTVNSYSHPTSSSTPIPLIDLIRRHGYEPDDHILRRLIQVCNINALEASGEPATTEEIEYFTEEKLKIISRSHNVNNPLALLVAVVPKCFEGESFRHYRDAKRRFLHEQELRQVRAQAELDQFTKEQQATLDNPTASEEEKNWARMSLGLDLSLGQS